jgi:hypothetical protein
MNTASPIVPDYYHIDFGDGIALRVLLREMPGGELPYVDLFITPGAFRRPVDGHLKTVEGAVRDIASEFQSLADALTRMADRLPAPSENS